MPAVSRTAIGVARARAAEARRSDRLFDDPYADAFVAAAGTDHAPADASTLTEEQRRWRAGIAFHISIRTRFYDDYVRESVSSGVEQIVLLGAGLDTRAFRLDLPSGLRWFELDLPEVLAFKQRVLDDSNATPHCRRTAIAAHLATDWSVALQVAGFDPDAPTAWLAEGLLVYLDATSAAHVLDIATSLSAASSRFAAERGDLAAQVAATPDDTRPDEASALWRGGVEGGVARWLAEHGWHPTTYDVTEVATSYERQAPPSTRSGLVTATR